MIPLLFAAGFDAVCSTIHFFTGRHELWSSQGSRASRE
jgi:hypothetical protein